MSLELKKEVAYFMRRLYRQKLTTTSGGNISARINQQVFITPSGTDKGRIQSKEIGECNFDAKNFTPELKLSMETPMHLAIYKARPDVEAIVHAHPPYGTAFASSAKTFESNLTSEGRLVLGNIGFAKYALMGTDSLAEMVAKEAQNCNVIFMENHGVIALGKNLLQAFDRLEVLEFTAQMQYITRSLSIDKPLNSEQLDEIDNMSL
jgi:L-fuculose-phosphate aldolase